MDVSSAAWLSELEMEGSEFKNQHEMTNPFIDAFSSESLTGYPYLFPMNQSFQDVAKQPKCKASAYTFAPKRVSSSNAFIMSFGNPNSPPEMNPYDQLYDESDLNYSSFVNKHREERNTNGLQGFLDGGKRVPGTNRNLTQAQDHVLAERKRREILTRSFISLSALLPNLKKMDKATVLEDATKYIKQLQTRMKELEETTVKSKRFKQESAVTIRRSKLSGDDDDDDETNSSPKNDSFNPEIEVRISEDSVLVRIHSHRNSSVVTKTLSEMKRLHLSISSSSVIPFSSTGLLITVTAQMSKESVLTAMDVVKNLQSAITNFIV